MTSQTELSPYSTALVDFVTSLSREDLDHLVDALVTYGEVLELDIPRGADMPGVDVLKRFIQDSRENQSESIE